MRYFNLFWNARQVIKVSKPILLILTLKLVAMATSLKQSEKGQILDLRSNTYHAVKNW